MSLKEAYKLLPPDCLHWSDIDNKFVLFSGKEVDKILLASIEMGIDPSDTDAIMAIVKQFEEIKVNCLLMERFFNGFLEFKTDDEGQLVWRAKNER